MLPDLTNPLMFLVTTLLNVVLSVLVLRILLQLTRADFFNPISQLIWRCSQPVIGPLTRALPRFRRWDIAATAVLVAVAFVYVWTISTFDVAWRYLPVHTLLYLALLKIVVLSLNLLTFTLFAQAVLSLLGPGISNPAANVLWSINEPLLRPVRRYVPPVSGLDLSPLLVMLLMQVLSHWLAPALGPFN